MAEPVETAVTEPNTEKLVPQSEVNDLMGRTREEGRKSGMKDLFSELGVANEESLKAIISTHNETIEQSKTELEKLQESVNAKDAEILELRAAKNNTDLMLESDKVLKEMGIEVNSNVVTKLIEKGDLFEDGNIKTDILKERIENTIKSDLPMLLTTKKVTKLGTEKENPSLPKSQQKEYLDTKYKNNPYYKG